MCERIIRNSSPYGTVSKLFEALLTVNLCLKKWLSEVGYKGFSASRIII